jgi:hypothetical protein
VHDGAHHAFNPPGGCRHEGHPLSGSRHLPPIDPRPSSLPAPRANWGLCARHAPNRLPRFRWRWSESAEHGRLPSPMDGKSHEKPEQGDRRQLPDEPANSPCKDVISHVGDPRGQIALAGRRSCAWLASWRVPPPGSVRPQHMRRSRRVVRSRRPSRCMEACCLWRALGLPSLNAFRLAFGGFAGSSACARRVRQ